MINFLPEKILKEAISPYNQYCDGFKSPGATGKGYVTTLILSIGETPQKFSHKGSQVLDSIIVYDKAEVESAYIGQINMTIVSSFLGLNGLIWGYDIAKSSNLKRKHPLAPSFVKEKERRIPIYDAKPLEKAALELFGSNKKRHFPFLPGAHVPCAGRYFTVKKPTHIYCAAAIGIPKDRSSSAALLMEDLGELANSEVKTLKKEILKNLAESVISVGKNQKIIFKEIFVSLIDKKIKKGEMGCSLVVIPYFTLAKKAIVDNDTNKMIKISLKQWEEKSKEFFIES